MGSIVHAGKDYSDPDLKSVEGKGKVMWQFIHGNEEAFRELERRCRQCCVVFRDQEMPPDTLPERGRVGFEADPSDQSVKLLLDRGLRYQGENEMLRAWIETGEKRFPDFHELQRWLRQDLRAVYPQNASQTGEPGAARHSPSPNPGRGNNPALSPAHLTDLAVANLQLRERERPLLLDEEAVLAELALHIRGQDQPLRMLARRICRHLARQQPGRPLTLFAMGPSGVGKTKTAETLPDVLRFLSPEGEGYHYLRLDMSEYQEL